MSFGVNVFDASGGLRLSITDRLPRFMGNISTGLVALGSSVTLICPEQDNENSLCSFAYRGLHSSGYWQLILPFTGILSDGQRGFMYTNSNLSSGVEYRAIFFSF